VYPARSFFSQLLIAFAAILILASSAHAQVETPTNTTTPPVSGAGHDYIKLLSETVNPANGSVSVQAGVPVPPGRGITFPFALTYDSNGVHVLEGVSAPGSPAWQSNSAPTFSGGWSYNLPYFGWTEHQILSQNPNPVYKGTYCRYNTGYLFRDASLEIHPLGMAQTVLTDPCISTVNNISSGGDGHYQASLGSGLIASDPSGTIYHCCSSTVGGAGVGVPAYAYIDSIEDSNGNKITFQLSSSVTGPFSITDTLGRTAVSGSGFGTSGNTLSVSGLNQPYTITWGTASSSFTSSATTINPPNPTCPNSASFAESATQNVMTAITLPNTQGYQFAYDPTYGELSKITYPTGGYVSYTWGLNSQGGSTSFMLVSTGGSNVLCQMSYDVPVVLHRYVSFDGTTVALQQDFSYSTTWNTSAASWSSKQTIVTTRDLLRGTSFQTTYVYSSYSYPLPPYVYLNSDNQIPIERTITYQDTNGATLRTTTKGWNDPYELGCELQTLDNGFISGVFNRYGSGGQLTDAKEYDFGLITSASTCQLWPNSSTPPSVTPTLETSTAYQAFGSTPIYPTGPSIYDRPSSVIIYGNGTRVAETDFAYDQFSIAGVSPTPTGHDELNYGTGVNPPRGNLTTATKQCFIGSQVCPNSVAIATYDETGHKTSGTDPNGNVTTYSYLDSYTDTAPPGNTNAYLTKVTRPTTVNGVSHVQSFSYAYSDGQPTVLTDENLQQTTYSYNDPFRRPTETDYPDGGQLLTTYNDVPPFPSITTSRKFNTTPNYVTSVRVVDGLGQNTQTQVTSDPSGTDFVDITYDGEGRIWKQSNPHRSAPSPTDGTTVYTYDALNRTTQITRPDGANVLTTYSGPAVQISDEGNGTQNIQRVNQVDGLGRLMSVCEVTTGTLTGNGGAPAACGQSIAATGFLTTYQYDSLNNITQVNQGTLAPRTFTFNSLSQLITATNLESGTACYGTLSGSTCQGNGYDLNGNVLYKTVPAQNQTGTATVTLSFCYDALNRPTAKAYSYQACRNGSLPSPASTFTYDSAVDSLPISYPIGRLVRVATSDGNSATVNSFDQMGRVKNQWQCTPQNCGTSYFSLPYTYDLAGDLLSAGNGAGVTLSYFYNGGAQLQSLTSSLADLNHPSTLLSNLTYNALSQPTASARGSGATETRGYNKRGWLQSSTVTDPSGGTASPGTGALTMSGSEQNVQIPGTAGTGSVTISGSERTTTYLPSGCHQTSCQVTVKDTGTVSVTVGTLTKSVAYGSSNTSAGIASSLASAFNGDSTSVATATTSGSIITFTAKQSGSQTNYAITCSSRTTNSHFTGTSFPCFPSGMSGGTDAQTIYDTGTISVSVNGSSATSYTYGQSDTPASVAAGLVSHLNSSFVNASASGAVLTLTAKTTGAATNYPLSVSVSYDTSHFSSGSFSATPSGNALTGGTDNTLYSFNISSFAPNGDVLSVGDSVNGSWTYSYDAFNRLLGANQNNGQFVYSYVYDRYGNRWQQNGGVFHPPALSFTGNNNHIDGYSYDAAGNLLNDGTNSFTYDAENRIVSVTNANGASTYVYDATGQRVRKTTLSGSVDFLYDLSGHAITELSSAGSWNRGEIYAGGSHIGTYSNSTTYFDHADWLGTERARTTVTGSAYQGCTSLPFGDFLTCSNSDSSPIHFTGKEHDSETGNDNFGARFYSSVLGRFVNADPGGFSKIGLVNPQAWNLYSYTLDNPANFIDPDGEATLDPKTVQLFDAVGNLDQTAAKQTTDLIGSARAHQTMMLSQETGELLHQYLYWNNQGTNGPPGRASGFALAQAQLARLAIENRYQHEEADRILTEIRNWLSNEMHNPNREPADIQADLNEALGRLRSTQMRLGTDDWVWDVGKLVAGKWGSGAGELGKKLGEKLIEAMRAANAQNALLKEAQDDIQIAIIQIEEEKKKRTKPKGHAGGQATPTTLTPCGQISCPGGI
jgi:RHS repeat-associated protein